MRPFLGTIGVRNRPPTRRALDRAPCFGVPVFSLVTVILGKPACLGHALLILLFA
jgi:hypothetical protein